MDSSYSSSKDLKMEYSGYESEGKGKRKQHCTYCKNHGKKSRKTNHKCEHEDCECLLCKLTRLSRLIMRHQQRLWRHLKDSKRREDAADAGGGGACVPSGGGPPDSGGVTGSTKQQKCDMCRNHGEITSKRAHKNACPYQNCTCALCNLTRKRRDIMRHQQRVRRSQVTSKQHNEAWEYVIQATAELEFLSSFKQTQTADDQNASSSSASASPSHDSSSTSASLSLKLEAIVSNSITPPTPIVTTSSSSKTTASTPTTPENMPPLELLPECSPPRYSPRPSAPLPTVPAPPVSSRVSEPLTPPDSVPPMLESESAWKSLKREREEFPLKWNPKVQQTREDLFGHLDFMRSHQALAGRLEPPVPMDGINFHDTIGTVGFGSHIAQFKNLVPMMDTSCLPPTPPTPTTPLKKSRTDENLHYPYSPMFCRNIPVEPRVGFVSEDLQQHCYRNVLMNNTDLSMRSPPGLIPIPQPQHPLRPRPLTLRPHTLPSSMEWDQVHLHYLAACFLQNRGGHYRDTLSSGGPFGLPRDAPFLHPPVP